MRSESRLKSAPKNLWDEMFARHAREREELLRWEDRRQIWKRASSTETVRVLDTSCRMASATDQETRNSLMAASSTETIQLLDASPKTTSVTDEKTEDQFVSEHSESGVGIRSACKGKRIKFDGDPLNCQLQISSTRKISCVIM
jgi:hypothetical protein